MFDKWKGLKNNKGNICIIYIPTKAIYWINILLHWYFTLTHLSKWHFLIFALSHSSELPCRPENTTRDYFQFPDSTSSCHLVNFQQTSVAVMFLHLLDTLLTDHVTAPDELAVTVLCHGHHCCVISSSAAHQRAAVQAIARLIALATPSARTSDGQVRVTEIRRLLQIDQVFFAGLLLKFIHGFEAVLLLVVLHAAGAIKFVLQNGADSAKTGHCFPADLWGTRPRHSVALTQKSHVGADSLKHKTQKCFHLQNRCNNFH